LPGLLFCLANFCSSSRACSAYLHSAAQHSTAHIGSTPKVTNLLGACCQAPFVLVHCPIKQSILFNSSCHHLPNGPTPCMLALRPAE
jgi:hypothetical protein